MVSPPIPVPPRRSHHLPVEEAEDEANKEALQGEEGGLQDGEGEVGGGAGSVEHGLHGEAEQLARAQHWHQTGKILQDDIMQS